MGLAPPQTVTCGHIARRWSSDPSALGEPVEVRMVRPNPAQRRTAPLLALLVYHGTSRKFNGKKVICCPATEESQSHFYDNSRVEFSVCRWQSPVDRVSMPALGLLARCVTQISAMV